MRGADGIHVEWVGDEAVVLDPDSQQLHYLNRSAALLYGLILEYGYEQGMSQLQSLHGIEADKDQELRRFLDDMVQKGLLIDD